jgi:hypothetical protein
MEDKLINLAILDSQKILKILVTQFLEQELTCHRNYQVKKSMDLR